MWMWIDVGILCDAQCRDISLFIEKKRPARFSKPGRSEESGHLGRI
jgi:hypothetical protein